METGVLVGWWVLLLATSRLAWRAWGPGHGVATVLGLWILSAQVDVWVGTIASAAAAVWIGSRAERTLRPPAPVEVAPRPAPIRHAPTSS